MNQTIANPKLFYKYAWVYFALAAAVIIAGFFPSFFPRLKQTDISHHIHGMSATGWLLLLIIQPYLYTRGNLQLHRKLGKLSFVLMPLLVIGGSRMVQLMIQSKAFYPPLEVYRLSFIDVVSMIAFVWFYSMAIYHRRSTGLHARYMAATVILLVPPGFVRFLFNIGAVDSFGVGLHISSIVLEIALLLLLLDDKGRDGKFSKPYMLMLGIIVFLHVCIPFVANWAWWQVLMNRIA